MLESFLESLNIKSLKKLKGFHNLIYEGNYQLEPIIIRVSHRKSLEQIENEVMVLNKIKHEVPVVIPIKVNNHYVIRHNDFTIAFFKKMEGLNWYETTLSDVIHFQAGKTLSLLHQAMQSIKPIKSTHYEEHPDVDLVKHLDPIYQLELKRVLRVLKSRDLNKNDYGLIHGDYLFSNLLYKENSVTIIDFDDMEYGYYLYDIAVYLFYLLLGGKPLDIDITSNIHVFNQFMRGYHSVNKTIELDFSKIEKLFRLRQLKLLATIKTTMEPSQYRQWQKDYIALTESQIKEGKPFTMVPYEHYYQKLLNEK